ncbi:RluA family pseudouridine synthase [Candidatus Saccharibacteria bacterium]|nr:MAG: RluA family pseudouridine synthase [Candidatus Saccharibacteria bacterium]
MQSFEVDETKRIDAVIATTKQLSRSFVNVLLDQGKVSVNGVAVYKPSFKVKAGDHIELDYAAEAEKEIPEIDLEILYEDDDCLVVIKPEGVLTHSKGAFNPEATVSTFIRPYTKGMEDNRGGIVHRLDRVTSGLLICAKHEKALQWLQKQFADRNAHKVYVAVVKGTPAQAEAVIDMPIERNPKKPQTFRVGPNGKPSVTRYKVLANNETHSLVELHPKTGRTHQLRVHLHQIGHPILGDTLYEGEPADRVYLHAASLKLTLPNGKKQRFEAPIPSTFNQKAAV